MKKKILVLLAAYNGDRYIEEQLNSIANQSIMPTKVFVSIDLSSDYTYKIVKKFKKKFPQINIFNFKKTIGSAAANFIYLLSYANFDEYDYISLSDQDDIWHKKKLETAIRKLDQRYDCYSSNVNAFWENGHNQVLIKHQKQKKYDFLFESAGPGCTFVFSKKFAKNLKNFLVINQQNLSSMKRFHDWLIYAYARLNNYKWYIDSFVGLNYRQHKKNDLGANVGLLAFWKRAKYVVDGHGFDQTLLLIKIFGLQENLFIKKWFPLSRFGFLKLALYAPQCRRRLSEKIYFFFACILLAIIFPKKLRTI